MLELKDAHTDTNISDDKALRKIRVMSQKVYNNKQTRKTSSKSCSHGKVPVLSTHLPGCLCDKAQELPAGADSR